jgi:hypothetical protein
MQLRFCSRFRPLAGLVLFALVAALVFSSPLSPAVASPQTPKGSLPADLVNYFAGTWTGKGAFEKSGRELASDYSFVPDLENQCLVVHQKEHPPNDFKFVALWSVDAPSGQVVMLMVSNHESGASQLRGSGWQDGKLVFQTVPEGASDLGLERFTFLRDSATSFHTTYEWSQDGGKTWSVGDRQSFTKSP